MIIEIKNTKSLFSLLVIQSGGIIGIELGLLICYFFVDLTVVKVIQLCVIPIIIIIAFSKYNKPLINIKIDFSNKIIIFDNAIIGRYSNRTIISFDQLYVNKRWKWLLNIYQEVIEISEGNLKKIVIPIVDNKQFINNFLKELIKLKDSVILREDQFNNIIMH
jgi:hypothetical protein